ncbi:uncharacterized protein CIMG_09334 [Coccidioides immitis RS]|uniref:Uncharacterized protein n=4 Tax=Coccidioides immitis TaxID=5501 RepID=J3K244_COCIM|nr:uncharacterized protein CIMG_09334 [Coccidioides immitis RS]KMP08947.1 hypothetical protein CIRG_08628 [Coccidioides immitis RMSCC 2394]KMU74102.1 hypothetical protein CISG_04031 [Coccidioides immitis RMSCC 3703]KMU89182.1 hypothetical protein CIHG_07116 [Coccidioides immitis H538.4]TPX20788.1 hypothetical protein DIZ76_016684 [Coccidioides immitis]EAS28130.3 hypothetical protein CIMG_09334 [Coccidioides immitis RS]
MPPPAPFNPTFSVNFKPWAPPHPKSLNLHSLVASCFLSSKFCHNSPCNTLCNTPHNTPCNTDHDSTAVKYYLDTVIRFDLQAAALEFPSDEAVQRAAHGLLLDADITAPTELPDDLQGHFDNDPTLTELSDKKAELLEAIKTLGFPNMLAAKGKTPLYNEWKNMKAKLQREKERLRTELMRVARDRHFRSAGTERMNRYLKGTAEVNPTRPIPPPLPVLQIPERERLVELIQQWGVRPAGDEGSRLACLRLWIGLQRRKEPRRPGKHKKQHLAQLQAPKPGSVSVAVAIVIPAKRATPVEMHPLTCPFCMADESLPDGDRFKIWDRLNKVWDHVEKNVHRNELEAYSSGTKPCGLCKMKGAVFVPSSTMEFKRHILDTRKWRFRGCRLNV